MIWAVLIRTILELQERVLSSVLIGAWSIGTQIFGNHLFRRSVGMKLELKPRSRHVVSLLLLIGIVTGGATGLPANAAESPVAIPTQALSKTGTIANAAKIPPEVVSTLRQDLSQRTGIPANQLRFIEVSSQTWPDGCLGLAGSGEMCTQAMVPGWRVVFAKGNQRWVYRTNSNGRTFRLETAQTRSSKLPVPLVSTNLQPAKIPVAELPPRLQQDVVFRTIATGGFTGQTIQTTLYRDGRLLTENMRPIGTSAATQFRQIPLQKVRQFITLLRRNQMHNLDRTDFKPTPGSADFITTTLACQFCTVRYADSIQAELPSNLQNVIQAWNELTRTI